METITKTTITVEATVNVPAEKAWKFWTEPQHIMQWNNANDDWHTPWVKADFREGGKFVARMEAKGGSMGFDFEGIYNVLRTNEYIEYIISDGRKVQVNFSGSVSQTKVVETFEAESENPIELQRAGWQAIMDNFKKYAERKNNLVELNYSITISASPEKVYNAMLDDATYRQWTAEFNPGSYFSGSWEKGSKMQFLGADENGNLQGISSRIKENIPGKFVSIEHLAEIKNGVEDTSAASTWAGALENYTFTDANGSTVLTIQTDTLKEFQQYFDDTWPKALAKLKTICEV